MRYRPETLKGRDMFAVIGHLLCPERRPHTRENAAAESHTLLPRTTGCDFDPGANRESSHPEGRRVPRPSVSCGRSSPMPQKIRPSNPNSRPNVSGFRCLTERHRGQIHAEPVQYVRRRELDGASNGAARTPLPADRYQAINARGFEGQRPPTARREGLRISLHVNRT